MTIDQKLDAVKEWLNFQEDWRHSSGEEPRLADWEAHLRSEAQVDALREVGLIATELLSAEGTREIGERLLSEIGGAGL